jgi:hypothetical protein
LWRSQWELAVKLSTQNELIAAFNRLHRRVGTGRHAILGELTPLFRERMLPAGVLWRRDDVWQRRFRAPT